MRRMILLAMFFLLLSVTAGANTVKREVEIKAKDGLVLKGTYYAAGQHGPGILLFHQCNRDHASWDSLATKLADQGLHVLAFDYRGFGGSPGEPWKWEGNLDKAMEYWHTKWADDMEAALTFLLAQPGVDGQRIGAGGASCGVYMAVLLAQAHPERVKTLVLLSGFSDAAGKDFISRSAGLPIFGAASEEDKLATEAIREMLKLSKNPESKLIIYQGAGHGVVMFDKEAALQPAVVGWFKTKLAGAVKSTGERSSQAGFRSNMARGGLSRKNSVFSIWRAVTNMFFSPDGRELYFVRDFAAFYHVPLKEALKTLE